MDEISLNLLKGTLNEDNERVTGIAFISDIKCSAFASDAKFAVATLGLPLL